MEKVYKSKLHRILINLVMGILVAGVAWFVATMFLEPPIPFVVGGVVFLMYLWLVILDNIITITVKDGFLTVQKGRKTKQFKIDECSFYAKSVSSSGDTSCSLTVTEANGDTERIDCELIGYGQFQDLLADLGMIGENAPVQKIQTKKGE